MRIGLHLDVKEQRTRAYFTEFRGCALTDARQAQIDALPLVEWKGKRLHTLRCHGTSGKGPHNVNVPASLLWSLIDLTRWRCPFHSGDVTV